MTLARAAEVIERVAGVWYSPSQTWTILRTRLRWSRQRPARRAVERDEEAIAVWKQKEWPRIKTGPTTRRFDLFHGRKWLFFAADGAGHLGTPWPDTGAEAPVLVDADVSMAGAVAYESVRLSV